MITRNDAYGEAGQDRPNGPECNQAAEWIGLSIDGEIDAADAAALASHLESCDACRRLDAEQREDWSLLGSLPEPPSVDADSYVGAVRHEIRAATRRRIARLVPAAAAAAVIAVAALFVGTRETAPDADFLQSVPVLVDLRSETRDLDEEMIGRIFDRLDPTAEAEPEEGFELELFLEEELEGTRL